MATLRRRGLIFLGVLAVIGFVAVADAVFYSGPARAADTAAAIWVNGLQVGGFLNALLVDASLYGREYFWVALVGIMVLFGDRDTKALAVNLSILFVAGILAGDALKAELIRNRPPLDLGSRIVVRVPLDTDSSFPSGHAVIVSIGAAFAALRLRPKLSTFLVLEAAVVCFSRVYVGVHFPLDVFGGAMVGFAVACLGIALEERYLARVTDALSALLVRLFRSGPLHLGGRTRQIKAGGAAGAEQPVAQ